MGRRGVATIVAVVLAALGVAACGNSASSGGLGGVGGSGGGGSSTGSGVVLGVIDDTSGPAASIGTLAKQSASLAVKNINAAGGVDGRKIKLVFYDNKSDPATTAQLASRLISQDHAAAIACCATSSAVAAAAAVAGRSKVPLLDSSQEQNLTAASQPWHGYLFRTAPDNNSLAKFNVEYAKARGWKRFAIETSSLSYGTEAVPYFKQVIAQVGGTVVNETTLDQMTTDASVQAAKIIKSKPDVVLSWDYPPPVAQLVKSLRSAGSQVPVVSNWSAINTTMDTIAGKLATNVYAHDTADTNNPRLKPFREQWRAAYHQPAPLSDFAVYGYTDVQVFAAALKAAPKPDSQGIREALTRLDCVRTVMGTAKACITFGPGNYEGGRGGAFAVMKTLKDGTWRVVPSS